MIIKNVNLYFDQMVYFSTNANPLYSTSDLPQIRYTTYTSYLLVRAFKPLIIQK